MTTSDGLYECSKFFHQRLAAVFDERNFDHATLAVTRTGVGDKLDVLHAVDHYVLADEIARQHRLILGHGNTTEFLLTDPAGRDRRGHPVCEREQCNRHVGTSGLGALVNHAHLCHLAARQGAREVEVVDHQVDHDVVGYPWGEGPDPDEFQMNRFLDAAKELAHGRVETLDVTDREYNPGLPGSAGQILALFRGRGNRLFYMHVQSRVEALNRHAMMKLGRRRHDRRVQLGGRQQLGDRSGMADTHGLGQGGALRLVDVDDRHELDALCT